MAALPCVRITVACCLLAVIAAQQCRKNQKLIRNHECDAMTPFECAMSPQMWVKPNGGKPYCDWCDWGEYSDTDNNKGYCTMCPQNTVITQGRYNSKFNEDGRSWCEEDCGIALRNMIKYPVGKLRIGCNGFCSDMFWVFEDSQSYRATLQGSDTYGMGIPCVNKGTTCTEADYKIADVMVVNYDESLRQVGLVEHE
jgi:hypothetical protein